MTRLELWQLNPPSRCTNSANSANYGPNKKVDNPFYKLKQVVFGNLSFHKVGIKTPVINMFFSRFVRNTRWKSIIFVVGETLGHHLIDQRHWKLHIFIGEEELPIIKGSPNGSNWEEVADPDPQRSLVEYQSIAVVNVISFCDLRSMKDQKHPNT